MVLSLVGLDDGQGPIKYPPKQVGTVGSYCKLIGLGNSPENPLSVDTLE